MIYSLPKSLTIGGKDYRIRSDFRDILEVISILNDADLTDQERGFFSLLIFYPDFKDGAIPSGLYAEAVEKCMWFINGGEAYSDEGQKESIMDWEKDFPIIIAPVSRVIGHDARADEYMHWWSFLAAYMEIGGECTFAQVIHIRQALRNGKPLDKQDAEWYAAHHKMVDMPRRYSQKMLDDLKNWG